MVIIPLLLFTKPPPLPAAEFSKNFSDDRVIVVKYELYKPPPASDTEFCLNMSSPSFSSSLLERADNSEFDEL